MKLETVVNPENYPVGVIVARYQVDDLHLQHVEFTDYVLKNHNKVIIFLGIPKTPADDRNPMDFATRMAMVRKLYPTAAILPITDERYNKDWVKKLDSKIREVFPNSNALLYGGKDSFVRHYIDGGGKFDTTELVSSDMETNGTDIREQISRVIIASSKFRKGVIHAVMARPATTYPTVDIVSHDGEGNILLAKKPNEPNYRFIGGFVDPTDLDYERAAQREYREETTGEINNLKYILSHKVDDWRYRKSKDGIMTTLFLGYHFMGPTKASDDIAEVKWFPISDFTDPDVIKRRIMPEHQEMMAKFVQKVYEQQLIPNLGEFYVEKKEPKDPNSVIPNEYEIKL
jgi:bifunctional NMN adenylyltransferase/nudix hydrolase